MDDARVAVVIAVLNGDELLVDAVHSIREAEPIQLVIVDDASTKPESLAVLDRLEAEGVHVIRQAEWVGPSVARNIGMAATTAPYVLPFDADDLMNPGTLAAMADRLDATPAAAACVGNYQEFGSADALRVVPKRLDPFRIAYNNDYPVTSLFRRSVMERYGGWREPLEGVLGYEDWNLWMSFAQDGLSIVHLGNDRVAYNRRLHGPGLDAMAKSRREDIYRAMREGHPRLFAELPKHRKATTLPLHLRIAYPLLFGDRRRMRGLYAVKPLLDRTGLWTRR